MKTITHALLGFVAGTALLFLIAVTTSCAGTKALHVAKMQPPHPAARMAIPVSCIDQVHGTEQTVCEATDPAHPDVALCGPLKVPFCLHQSCSQIKRRNTWLLHHPFQ
jgi:hypothetical protein